MSALIGPRLLHINLVCAIFYFFEYNNASKPRPASARSILMSVFFVLMGETLPATEQGDLRMRCGTHRVRELAAADNRPLIDAQVNQLGGP
jgi:hypothetical protein